MYRKVETRYWFSSQRKQEYLSFPCLSNVSVLTRPNLKCIFYIFLLLDVLYFCAYLLQLTKFLRIED